MPLTDKNGQLIWRKQYESAKKYEAANTIRFSIKLNKNTDADVINAIYAAPNKQGFFKNAIRFYLENKK